MKTKRAKKKMSQKKVQQFLVELEQVKQGKHLPSRDVRTVENFEKGAEKTK